MHASSPRLTARGQVDTLRNIIATARQTSVEKTFSEPMEVLRFPERSPPPFSKPRQQHRTSFHSEDDDEDDVDADTFDIQTHFTRSTAVSRQRQLRPPSNSRQPLHHHHHHLDRPRGVHSVGSVGSRSARSHHSARPRGRQSTRGQHGSWAGSEDSRSAAGSTQFASSSSSSSVSRWRRPAGSTNYASPTTSSIARSRYSAR